MLKRSVHAGIVALLVTGCSSHGSNPGVRLTDRGDYYVDTSHPSQSQNERVRFLVLHYTAVDDAESLRLLTQGQASAHYLVPSQPGAYAGKPVLLQLVPEDKRAWHAGVSTWNGRVNLNDSSIGIEIVNRGFTEDSALGYKTWYPYGEAQIAAVAALAKDVVTRYGITPDNVLGHSDIAPLRKYDPGPLFPWQRLATLGIGAWPDQVTVSRYLAGRAPDAPADVAELQRLLARYGYDQIPQSGVLDDATRRTFSAFQAHFRPRDITGVADAETEAIARALLEKYRGVTSV